MKILAPLVVTLSLATGAAWYLMPSKDAASPAITVATDLPVVVKVPKVATALPAVPPVEIPKEPTLSEPKREVSHAPKVIGVPQEKARQVSVSVPLPVVPAVVPAPLMPQVPSVAKFSDDELNGYAALEMAQHMEGRERINAVREGMTLLANANVDRAVVMANSLTNEHDHGVAVGTLLRVVSERNPRQAADIFFRQVPPETSVALINYPRTADLMRKIVAVQVQADPIVAVNWAKSLQPAPSLPEAPQRELGTGWTMSAGASSGGSALPDGGNRDAAYEIIRQAIMSSASDSSAGQALQWANQINDAPSRQESLKEVLRRGNEEMKAAPKSE